MLRAVNAEKMMRHAFYAMSRRSLLYPMNQHQLLHQMELCVIPSRAYVATRVVPFVRTRTVAMMSMVLSKSQSRRNVVPGISHHLDDCVS